MSSLRSHQLFRRAIETTRRQIETDAKRVSKLLTPILLRIAERLFDPDFSLGELERGWKLEARRSRFCRELGCRPKDYVFRRKMETAARLLRSSKLPIWKVAEGLEYRHRNFSRDFKRWSGVSPGAYRRSFPDFTDAVTSLTVDAALGARALAGDLERHEARRLVETIEQTAKPRPLVTLLRGGSEREWAECLWQALRPEPGEVIRRAIRQAVVFESPAFFHLLCEKSLEEGRQDRQRGIELAELALEALDANAATLAENLPALRAYAQAVIGNAHRLANDFPAADVAFHNCHRELARCSSSPDPWLAVEILGYEGALRRHQRRFEHALELLDRAVELGSTLEDRVPLIKALLQRVAVAGYGGRPEETLPDLLEALELLASVDEPLLETMAYQSLAVTYVFAGAFGAAAAVLPRAQILCEAHGNPLLQHQLETVAGLVRQGMGDLAGAGRHLTRARAGMISLRDRDHTAAVSMELAVVRFRQGRCSSAARLASEAIPLFASIQASRDVAAAHEMLREAIVRDRLTEEALLEARGCMRRLSHDPAHAFGR